MRIATSIITGAMLLALAGCQTEREPTGGDEPGSESSGTPESEATVSILRPDIEQPVERKAQYDSPYTATIGFPEGGSELDADAIANLEKALASEQMAMGEAIILRAHSDAGGSDEANARASEARGLAVARWLVENGIDDDRIDVIVFGEQNPIAPNALPDGSPSEGGRAANRRVEIEILVTNPEPVRRDATETDNRTAGAAG